MAPQPDGTARCSNGREIEAHQRRRNRAGASAPSADGSLFVGDKGMMTTGTYGEETRLMPMDKMKSYEFPPELLTRSPGYATIAIGFAPAKAASPRAPISAWLARSSSGWCWP